MLADANAEVKYSNDAPDEDSRTLCLLFLKAMVNRDWSRALCYKDIFIMLVRDPITGRTIPAILLKFIYYKGCDNRLKPYVSLDLTGPVSY